MTGDDHPAIVHDPKALRSCFGRFATGVTIVTAVGPEGDPHGLTVNSFTSVSMDPPLVLVSIARQARSCSILDGNGFVVNVLAEHQAPLAWHFAGRPDDLLDIPWTTVSGRPAIAGSVAHISCAPFASYDGGDHVLYLGEVESFAHEDGDPLLFHLGRFARAGSAIT